MIYMEKRVKLSECIDLGDNIISCLKEAKKAGEGYTIKGLVSDIYDVPMDDLTDGFLDMQEPFKFYYVSIRYKLETLVSEGLVDKMKSSRVGKANVYAWRGK